MAEHEWPEWCEFWGGRWMRQCLCGKVQERIEVAGVEYIVEIGEVCDGAIQHSAERGGVIPGVYEGDGSLEPGH